MKHRLLAAVAAAALLSGAPAWATTPAAPAAVAAVQGGIEVPPLGFPLLPLRPTVFWCKLKFGTFASAAGSVTDPNLDPTWAST